MMLGLSLALSALRGGGGVAALPEPALLTARGAVMMPQRNGSVQALRYEAPEFTNWMRSGSARQAGAMMIDLCIDDAMALEGVTHRANVVIAGDGATTAAGDHTWSYNSNSAASNKRTVQLYVRTNEMSSAGEPAMIAYSPAIRDAEACTLFSIFSATELMLAVAYADGTVEVGSPVTMPASFAGRANPGVCSIGGATATAPSGANFGKFAFGRFGYLRGRVPTTTEMQRVARGESPASVFAGELDRYYPLTGPTDIAPSVGSGDLILRSYGTESGYAVRRCGTLSGATDGTVGFSVKQPLWGDGWALDLDDIAAGAPVALAVTNTLGAATQFEARAVLYSDGATFHKPWTVMSGGAVDPGQTAVLTLPSVTWSPLMQIEVRRVDAPAVTWASHPVGVGPDIIDDGQSQRNIWGTKLTTNATVLAAVTIAEPCVVACWPFSTAGPVGPYNHRLIDTAIDTPIGPAAFAMRWAGLTGNKWARIRSIAVEGSGRGEYTANNNLPKTSYAGPYKYWGTAGVLGSGIVADMLLRCGPRFSALVGHYASDDLLAGSPFVTNADPYFLGTGSPSRSWAQVTNPIGFKAILCEADRSNRSGGSTTIGGMYDTIRGYVSANSPAFRLGPPNTLDKMFETSSDQAHQSPNVLQGNARMGVRYATWLAGLCGDADGMGDAGTLVSVTSASPFSSAVCAFSLPPGAALTTTDGAGQAFGFEVSVGGGAWARVPVANAVISGNSVTISGITGAASAADIRVRLNYDHVWGTSTDAAVRYAEDNLTIDKVLLATVAGSPAWAAGMPLRPSNGAVTAL